LVNHWDIQKVYLFTLKTIPLQSYKPPRNPSTTNNSNP
jgi:hypothetical protein